MPDNRQPVKKVPEKGIKNALMLIHQSVFSNFKFILMPDEAGDPWQQPHGVRHPSPRLQ